MPFKFADKVTLTQAAKNTMHSKYVGRIGLVIGVDADDESFTYVGFNGQFYITPVPTSGLQFFKGDYWYFAHLIGEKKPVGYFSTHLECLEAAKKLSVEKKNFPYLLVHAVETDQAELLFEEAVIIGNVVFKAESLNV